jgi:hypothetical protein
MARTGPILLLALAAAISRAGAAEQPAADGRFEPMVIRLEPMAPALLQGDRAGVIAALRQHAADTQAALLARLAQLESQGRARDIRPLWISSLVAVDLRAGDAGTRADLAALHGVMRVAPDPPRRAALESPVLHVPMLAGGAVGPLAPGAVVAIADTGAPVLHPGLASRLWINIAEDPDGDRIFTAADQDGIDGDRNGYRDDVVGWDFVDGDALPQAGSPHEGAAPAQPEAWWTILGPGARVMVLRTGAGVLARQAHVWEAAQYAVEHGAAVLLLACGWRDEWNPDGDAWRDVLAGARAAGVRVLPLATVEPGPPRLYRVHVAGPDEVRLLREVLGLKPVRQVDGDLYYEGDAAVNQKLARFGYAPDGAFDPGEVVTNTVVFIAAAPGEAATVSAKSLRDLGLRLLRREGERLIVFGPQARIDALAAELAGRFTREPHQGPLPRPRLVRVAASDRAQAAAIAANLSDLWSVDEAPGGFIVVGVAWDDQIERLVEQGNTILPQSKPEPGAEPSP